MTLKAFHSPVFPFVVLTDGEEFRFITDTVRGTVGQMWESAVPGELLDEMLEEYNRIKSGSKALSHKAAKRL